MLLGGGQDECVAGREKVRGNNRWSTSLFPGDVLMSYILFREVKCGVFVVCSSFVTPLGLI